VTPFERLGLEPRYEIDVGRLERAYRALQRQVHPDRFARSDAKTRIAAAARAIEINDAYRIVRDPLRRAQELLRLRGVLFAETSGPKVSADFLADVLELRESLGEARAAGDVSRVRALADDVRARFRAAECDLSAAFEAGDTDVGRLADAFVRLKYFHRFLEESDAILSDAADGAARET
jgi:molecular chaperone HscB